MMAKREGRQQCAKHQDLPIRGDQLAERAFDTPRIPVARIGEQARRSRPECGEADFWMAAALSTWPRAEPFGKPTELPARGRHCWIEGWLILVCGLPTRWPRRDVVRAVF